MFIGEGFRVPTNKYLITGGDKGGGFPLIGVLRRLEYDEYSFEYLLGDSFPIWWLKLDGFSELHKLYGTEDVKKHMLLRLFWEEGDFRTDGIMRQYGLEKYNLWELLQCRVGMYREMFAGTTKEGYSDPKHRMFFWEGAPSDSRLITYTERRDWLD